MNDSRKLQYITEKSLSKAKRCPKLLWHDIHEPRDKPKLSRLAQWQKDQIDEMMVWAQGYFSEGILIEDKEESLAFEATQKAMAGDAPVIINGAFVYRGLLLRADIVERNEDGSWNLIVIKAASRLKHQHVPDVAFQHWGCMGYGLKIKKSSLLLINNKYIRQDNIEPNKMFYLVDVTHMLKNKGPRVDSIDKAVAMANANTPQKVETGSQCERPYPCLYMDLCHTNYVAPEVQPATQIKGKFKDKVYPIDHVFSLGKRKGRILVEKGIKRLKDIPPKFKLDPLEKIKQKVGIENKAHVNTVSIRRQLDTLVYPIYFLDFELFAPLIPAYKGTGPYGAIPFQYSLWVKRSPTDEAVALSDYLHREQASDPRPGVVKNLTDHIGESGSIVVYSLDTEKTVLNKLADFSSEHKNTLNNMADRLWDLAPIFKNDYIHPQFRGRFSIKVVLPTLVPRLSYVDLDVDDGRIASDSWEAWHAGAYEGNADRLHDDLVKYCSLDVEAMVRLLEVVEKAIV